MTDVSGLLRDWRAVLAGCLSVLVAGVVTLVVRTGDPATADSYLSDVRDAAVVLSGGTLVIAHDGQLVPVGATVKTGAGGAARLTTAGRDVYLGALTTLHVVDGVHQRLDRGQVMVDGRGGPRLDLDTRAGTAALPGGSLVRAELGPVLRLGVFQGEASLTAAGRQATTKVPVLYQVQAPYTGIPGRPTPLALADDPWEQRLAAELVTADTDLKALARALAGADGSTVLQAAPVALRQVLPTSSDRGEQALGVAIAQAARGSEPVGKTLSFVQKARDEGGSWGVVAALVDARVTAVSALLDTVLSPPGQTPTPVLAGPTPFVPGGSGGSPTPDSGTPSTTPSVPGGPKPTRTPTSRPTSPSPTSTADDLVNTVMNLLSPTPSPGTQVSPRPTGLIHIG